MALVIILALVVMNMGVSAKEFNQKAIDFGPELGGNVPKNINDHNGGISFKGGFAKSGRAGISGSRITRSNPIPKVPKAPAPKVNNIKNTEGIKPAIGTIGSRGLINTVNRGVIHRPIPYKPNDYSQGFYPPTFQRSGPSLWFYMYVFSTGNDHHRIEGNQSINFTS